jgi:uncharacterized SAM-binding protein YcdF (DUF218 family)
MQALSSALVTRRTMLQELKPLLLPLLLPPIPMLLAMLTGAGLLRRHRAWGRALLLAGALGLWLACTEIGAAALQRLLLGPERALDGPSMAALRAAPEGSAVLVLGGGARQEAPEYGGPTLKPLSLERLRYGIWLARRSGLPLGFSGGIPPKQQPGALSEAALARQIAAQEWQLPLRWVEERSRDTRENASLSLPLLRRDGIRRIVLVTHVQHMPRALRAFRAAAGGDVEIVPAPVGLRASSPFTLGDWWPAGEAIQKTRYVIYEWLGLLAGR